MLFTTWIIELIILSDNLANPLVDAGTKVARTDELCMNALDCVWFICVSVSHCPIPPSLNHLICLQDAHILFVNIYIYMVMYI